MAVPRYLIDLFTRHQVLLERLKAGEGGSIDDLLAQVDAAVRAKLAAANQPMESMTRGEMEDLVTEIIDEKQALGAAWKEQFYARLRDLAGHEADVSAAAMGEAVLRGGTVSPISARAAWEFARRYPVQATGKLLEPFVSDWTEKTLSSVEALLRNAHDQGWTIEQTVRALKGTKAKKYADGLVPGMRRSLEALTRTAMQHISNTARAATFEANADIVTGYRWVATLERSTCVSCAALDGEVFPLGKGPRPPQHVNCRCTMVPDMEGSLELLGGGAKRAAKGPEGGAQVPANMTYFAWLKTQPASFQDTVLGPARAKLLRDGGLSSEEFARLNLGRNFQPLTLAQMKALKPEAFNKAGVDIDGVMKGDAVEERVDREAAERLGLAKFTLDGDAALANRVAESLARARERGMTLPAIVRVVSTGMREDEAARTLLGPFPVLQVNPAARAQLSEPWSASSDVVLRELGHLAHVQGLGERATELGARRFTADERATAVQVSHLAGAGPAEFVAEVFAGRAAGKSYGPEVAALYDSLGGPPEARADAGTSEGAVKAWETRLRAVESMIAKLAPRTFAGRAGFRESPLPRAKLSEEQRKEAGAWDWGKGDPPVEEVDPRSLSSAQDIVSEETLHKHAGAEPPRDPFQPEHPVVYRTKQGQTVVLNGNHRVAVTLAEGRDRIAVHVIQEGAVLRRGIDSRARAHRSDAVITTSQCSGCEHFHRDQKDFTSCNAFPDWIPPELLLNRADHSEPFPGDHGIHFSPLPVAPPPPDPFLAEMLAARQDGHSGTYLGLKVPLEAAYRMAVNGGEPADSLHLTLFYAKGLTPEQAALVEERFREVWSKYAPIRVSLDGTGVFPASASSDGKDVLYARPVSPVLLKLRQEFVDLLAAGGVRSNSEHPFTPHITLKYLEPGETHASALAPQSFEVDEFEFDPGESRADAAVLDGWEEVARDPETGRWVHTGGKLGVNAAQAEYLNAQGVKHGKHLTSGQKAHLSKLAAGGTAPGPQKSSPATEAAHEPSGPGLTGGKILFDVKGSGVMGPPPAGKAWVLVKGDPSSASSEWWAHPVPDVLNALKWQQAQATGAAKAVLSTKIAALTKLSGASESTSASGEKPSRWNEAQSAYLKSIGKPEGADLSTGQKAHLTKLSEAEGEAAASAPPKAHAGVELKLEKLSGSFQEVAHKLGGSGAFAYHEKTKGPTQKWFNALPESQRAALSYYKGEGYAGINSKLRKRPVGAPVTGHTAAIQAAIKAARPLGESLVVWRGFHYSALAKDPVGLLSKQGNVIFDKGFVSTSVSYDTARAFAGHGGDGVIVRITLPKGTKTPYLSGGGAFAHEREHLLQRGSKFKVTRVIKAGGLTILDAHYLGSKHLKTDAIEATLDAAESGERYVWAEGEVEFGFDDGVDEAPEPDSGLEDDRGDEHEDAGTTEGALKAWETRGRGETGGSAEQAQAEERIPVKYVEAARPLVLAEELGAEDHLKWADAHRAEATTWRKHLAEAWVVDEYEAAAYRRVNADLRGKEVSDSFNAAIISGMTGAIEEAPPLDRDTYVWRGLKLPELAKDPAGFLAQNGNLFEDKAFVSTSLDAYTAEQFAGSNPSESVVVQIKLPKGTRAAPLLEMEESELTLQRDAVFKAKRVYKTSTGFTVLQVEYLRSTPKPLTELGWLTDSLAADAERFVWNANEITFRHEDDGERADTTSESAKKAWDTRGRKQAEEPEGAKKEAGQEPAHRVSLKAVKARVWSGKAVPVKTKVGKAELGSLGEDLAVEFLKTAGFKDAKALHFTASVNFPLDLVADHHLYEVKTGVSSSQTPRWRITIGEPGEKEKAWLKQASPEAKAAWNQRKIAKAIARKQKVVAEFSKKAGRKLEARTVALIVNPDTHTADVHVLAGFHANIGWNGELARSSYVGTYRYA